MPSFFNVLLIFSHAEMYEPSIGDIIPDPPGPPMTRGTLLCSTGLLTPHSLTPFTPPRCLHSHDSCQDRPAPRYRQDKALISFSERLQEHKWIWPQFHFTKLCCTEMRLWDCSIACHSVPGLTLSLIILISVLITAIVLTVRSYNNVSKTIKKYLNDCKIILSYCGRQFKYIEGCR